MMLNKEGRAITSPSPVTVYETGLSHLKGVSKVLYTPDGRHILSTGRDGHMRLWNATTGEHQVLLHSLRNGYYLLTSYSLFNTWV